eukprot:TRINITY_DN12784_c0_g1_i1.p1 TRINITY_DN12784_c0_g1~~TRINITY_DN12784_c0_g1_i1.p1  ORF type:complete len:356 (+),score=80.56 TRINITY_DN12784_c0_g1_i1:53-1120(+)
MAYRDELIATARALASPGKGILAADESTATIGKRFEAIKLENTLENRRAYRELLFTTPGDWEKSISGVIMYEETLTQQSKDGVPFVKLLQQRGVFTGIKVDKGTVNIPGTAGDLATQGLDDLHKRCQQYYQQGARFAKWRAVVKIGPTNPSEFALVETAHSLARYAAICQENGLVPIVEPEVLLDGSHSIEVCAAVSERAFAYVVKALHDQHILLEGILLKPNMITPGSDAPKVAPEVVAEYTVRTLARTLPAAVPGVNFLSGGQSEEEATTHLNAINKVSSYPRPWNLSFSYGRALQQSTITTWGGKPENVAAAQKVYFDRATANGLAAAGKYVPTQGAQGAAAQSLFERGYTY